MDKGQEDVLGIQKTERYEVVRCEVGLNSGEMMMVMMMMRGLTFGFRRSIGESFRKDVVKRPYTSVGNSAKTFILGF